MKAKRRDPLEAPRRPPHIVANDGTKRYAQGADPAPHKRPDDAVEFRATRSQAKLIRDACRAYAKGLGRIARTPTGRMRSAEAMKTSMLLGFLADQIELALKLPTTPVAASGRKRKA